MVHFGRRILVSLVLPAIFPLFARSRGPTAPQSSPVKSANVDTEFVRRTAVAAAGHSLSAAKDHDTPKLNSLIKQMEIPDYAAWFTKIFGEVDGKLMADNYRGNFTEGDTFIETLFTQLASENGKFTFRKLSDQKPGGEPGEDDPT